MCRRHGINGATFYKWKAKYGGLDVSEARRTCWEIATDRTTIRYRQLRGDDGEVRLRLRVLSAEGRRFGYRRLHVLLRWEGIWINHKKLRRLYGLEQLQVRCCGGYKRAVGTRAPMALPQGPNQRWSFDFVSDTLTDGRWLRVLAVVEDFTRECLCLLADTSLSGKPQQNAFMESFNGRLRDECLNETLFTSLAYVRSELKVWQRDYNEVRPHSTLGGRSPASIRPASCLPAASPDPGCARRRGRGRLGQKTQSRWA